jgi:3'-phosphoadenosine 5'-phosphosulfate sulfotransferase (PAPS reductase)/FAD synthetase
MNNKLQNELTIGRIFRKSIKYKKDISFANNGINIMLNICKSPSLSLSFGKQSICLAHLVYSVKQNIPMYFLASSETWWLDTYTESLKSFIKICPNINLTIVQTNRLAIDMDDIIAEIKSLGVKLLKRGWNTTRKKTWDEARKSGSNDIQSLLDQDDFDGWFWGLSTDESFNRKRTLLKQIKTSIHPSMFQYTNGKYRCCPLMYWGEETLAGYIDKFDLPLLSAYKIGGLKERTTARITGTSDRMQAFERMRRNQPEGYAKIVNVYPELASKT